MAGNLKLLTGLAAGYVLGARAGRERYERIAEASRRLAERPEIRELTGKVRSGIGAGLEKAAATASDRLQQIRGEQRGPEHVTSQAPRAEVGDADEETGADRGSSPEPGASAGRRERSRSAR